MSRAALQNLGIHSNAELPDAGTWCECQYTRIANTKTLPIHTHLCVKVSSVILEITPSARPLKRQQLHRRSAHCELDAALYSMRHLFEQLILPRADCV